MSEIRQWLERLDLSRHADAFEDNDVGVDVLATLTDADLKDLGVSLGNRRRILAAIAAPPPRLGQGGHTHELGRREAARTSTVSVCILVTIQFGSLKRPPNKFASTGVIRTQPSY